MAIKNAAGEPRALFVFAASQPVRYLACVVSRLLPVDTRTLALRKPDAPPPASATGARYAELTLSAHATPRQRARARELLGRTEDIAAVYAAILQDAPYPGFTLAVLESYIPGGHSPAYFAAFNQPLPTSPFSWRDDPASFDNYPEFFLAHELAHQWWGQAVGWKNYHEQWLSEGFAQYFAAIYAERRRGSGVFDGIIRSMSRWAVSTSDQGAVYLGYRLGHIKNDGRILRALVYNKGAMVLHMLRRLVGDDAFFRGLRRFYDSYRFQKAGTDELREVFEAESGQPLSRFFEEWIYGSDLPVVTVTWRVDASGPGQVARRARRAARAAVRCPADGLPAARRRDAAGRPRACHGARGRATGTVHRQAAGRGGEPRSRGAAAGGELSDRDWVSVSCHRRTDRVPLRAQGGRCPSAGQRPWNPDPATCRQGR